MEPITVHNGENFVFPKVNILENGELSFEIKKENSIVEIKKEDPIVKDKPKKNCIKYISTCTST
jgi:hypothetical protein